MAITPTYNTKTPFRTKKFNNDLTPYLFFLDHFSLRHLQDYLTPIGSKKSMLILIIKSIKRPLEIFL